MANEIQTDPSRRTFLGGLAGAGAASLVTGAASAAVPAASKKRRYAIVGTGIRAVGMWGKGLARRYPDVIEFAGICDINPKRLLAAKNQMTVDCPTFTNFDEMLDKTKPDLLAVLTVDAFHSEYIIKGLERGLDVLTEKPMVIDEKQCQAVLDAEKRAKRKLMVAFNYRFAPKHIKIKEILMSGELGKVQSVSFDWDLDVSHGADYFRRWHRLTSKSGSLFVHKATHHFDLMNWWLGADPVEVTALGRLAHYGKNGPFRHTNCRPCPHKKKCSYYWDITKDARAMELYVSAEKEDGYLRDGCVYRTDADSYDTMSTLVRYSNGAQMSYSLNAYMPTEGYHIKFTCDKGTLDVRVDQHDEDDKGAQLVLHKSFRKPELIVVPKGVGGHGGGDDHIRDLIFRNIPAPAHLALPGSHAGAMSCLTGIAARKSVIEGQPIKIADLARGSKGPA